MCSMQSKIILVMNKYNVDIHRFSKHRLNLQEIRSLVVGICKIGFDIQTPTKYKTYVKPPSKENINNQHHVVMLFFMRCSKISSRKFNIYIELKCV